MPRVKRYRAAMRPHTRDGWSEVYMKEDVNGGYVEYKEFVLVTTALVDLAESSNKTVAIAIGHIAEIIEL